jgi:prepilin signal peptidase PulO-like enzyme (type II secretory pathway)
VLFVLGCCLGGLINLGIYRLAWHAKSISPWSRPLEKAPSRRIWDRLPVIGWLGLRREAPLHGRAFWIRPMLIELLCGAVLVFLYLWEVQWWRLVPHYELLVRYHLLADDAFSQFGIFGPLDFALPLLRHQQFIAHAVLFCFMVIAFWIDVDEMTIPDGVTIPGTLAGLLIVALWPGALLPQWQVPEDRVQPKMLSPVWLTSPDDVPPAPEDVEAVPRFNEPWNNPAVTGGSALAAAITVIWIWSLSLAPGHWSKRHGYLRAMRVFTARALRERATYGLMALAAVGSIVITCVWWRGGPHWAGLATGLAGLAVGGALTQIVRVVASFAMGREAMGFGDVTLLAMIGAFLGWQASIVIFFMAPLYALLIGIGKLILRGEREIPFGPFLCLGAATTVVFWPAIWKMFGARNEFGFSYFSLGWKLLAVLFVCLCLMPVLLFPIRWIADRIRGAAS